MLRLTGSATAQQKDALIGTQCDRTGAMQITGVVVGPGGDFPITAGHWFMSSPVKTKPRRFSAARSCTPYYSALLA